ncbi:acyl-CoA dehydrogenase family protein [Shouchella lonarensis]|uniref:Acyl-CoA dehydrogenase n=1 Tax=Shouchella lonarensis TaxID=1464122 RepID=A0A1G6KI16_9BACI|nr:acyl-CoA dehydrogenase family protein [Shouchella lonarensis]SDC30205.1 Acyl-CoA dehydrogenase [Shouchella lonarensis]
MSVLFSEEQMCFRQELKDFFSSQSIQEKLIEVRKNKDYDPREIYEEMGKRGYLAANWSAQYGGLGKSWMETAIVAEEMSLHGIPEALQVISIQIVGNLLWLEATEQQKKRYLPLLAKGEAYASVLYTEPQAGSDLGSLETYAEPLGDHRYAIYGTKVYSMKTHLSDYGLCAARTTTGKSKYDGMTLFMVPLFGEGVDVRPIPSMGDESFYEVTLNGATVTEAEIIGEKDHGWSLINKALAVERTGLDYYIRALRWLNLLPEFSQTHCKIARVEQTKLASKVENARLLTYRVLRQLDESGEVDEKLTLISKWYASELANEVVDFGMKTGGFASTLRDAEKESLEAAYREAPGLTISAGSSEMMMEALTQLVLISKE